MSEVWGAQRPVISAEEAERWAGEEGLRFPELVAHEAPEWEWHDGGEGFYVGYLPTDWAAGVEDCSYELLELSDCDDDENGIYEWFFDLGVCTVVVRGDRNELWQDEPFAIPVLAADDIDAWQRADGWFDGEVDEFEEYFEPVFDGFEKFDPRMYSHDLGFSDSPTGLVAIAQGWAERRGPYCEWLLVVRQLEDGTFIGLGGPPTVIPTWRFRREFADLEQAAVWMKSAAESIGATAEPGSEWQERWPA
jgi:hypothetical protein